MTQFLTVEVAEQSSLRTRCEESGLADDDDAPPQALHRHSPSNHSCTVLTVVQQSGDGQAATTTTTILYKEQRTGEESVRHGRWSTSIVRCAARCLQQLQFQLQPQELASWPVPVPVFGQQEAGKCRFCHHQQAEEQRLRCSAHAGHHHLA